MSNAIFFKEKKNGYKFRHRKTLEVKENGRSADFIIPSFAIGCELGCSYCYVARNRPFGNPLEQYLNIDEIWAATKKHIESLGPKTIPNQCDPKQWTYDIGESTDCLTNKIVPVTNAFINCFVTQTDAKPTFATKLALPERLIEVPRDKARVRISLMPQDISDILEKGTSKIADRIESIPEFYLKGYEVHLNFSPLIGYSSWIEDYSLLLKYINQRLPETIKKQLKCEIICLTHDERLHELNKEWNPQGEEYLRRPSAQEYKINQRGSQVIRYKYKDVKPYMLEKFQSMLKVEMPYCAVRYAF